MSYDTRAAAEKVWLDMRKYTEVPNQKDVIEKALMVAVAEGMLAGEECQKCKETESMLQALSHLHTGSNS